MSSEKIHKMKKHISQKNSSECSTSGLMKAVAISLAVSVALCFALALVFSAAALSYKDPDSLCTPFAIFSLYISSFVCGLICKKRCNDSSGLCGIICGGTLLMLFVLISFFIPSELATPRPFIISLLLHLLIIVFSLLGAIAGNRRKTKHKPKR